MFTGEYRHAIDDKGRVAVPVRFRPELAEGAVVTRWMDGCLALFPRQAWDRLAARVASLPVTDSNARELSRLIFGGAFELKVDGQGRALVPANLREQAEMTGEAVLVGMNDRIELWSPGRWASYSKGLAEPGALAQRFHGLGI